MNDDIVAIQAVIEDYFIGTYEADETRIKRAFHHDAKITGNIDGNYVEINLEQFIARVKTAKSAANLQERTYDKKITTIQLHGDLAAVNARVLVDHDYYSDCITLLKINQCWVIRQKSFTNAQ